MTQPLEFGQHAFASDNYAGAHPEIIAAITAANDGHQVSYGDDVYTERLQYIIAKCFGAGATAYPVFNGTGANVLSLQSMMPRWGAVITAATAHVNNDEGGAPERVGGIKLMPVDTSDAKLTPALIDREAWGWGETHRAQPAVVSITQSTELGTVYSVDEVRAIAEHTHELGMLLHMDGARIANAAASLDVPLSAFTSDAGVDVLSFGGTKNGLLFGEAVVVLNPDAVSGFEYVRKYNMQTASKMRFLSAQLIALLEDQPGNDPLWLRSARQANAMATRIRTRLDAMIESGEITGLAFTQPTQVNGLFATMPTAAANRVRERFRFYDWDASIGEVRWMCSFDTTEQDADAFVEAIREALTG